LEQRPGITEIGPRWEWRSFGRRFGVAGARLERLTPSGVQKSDEIYLPGPSGGNVKIRDALMDIKVLREVSADGLEQWTPDMKAGFCSSKPVRPQTTSCMRCCRRSSPGS
jgi:exopolyphosphatase/guanosine-5'-triphosphate,3'-diphosphate pyrophosphatase